MAAQRLIRRLPVGEAVVERILDLVRAARPGTPDTHAAVRDAVSWGPGPRAAQALMLAIRARALIQGRLVPGIDDVAALAHPVLIHRMALGFAARAEGQTLDRADRPAGRRRSWALEAAGVIAPRPRGRDKPQGPVGLRRDAEKIGGALPPLLAAGRASSRRRVAMGFHGRRRAGHGENFWQYRQAVPGDARSMVDWRRSGKSDQQFIREMEWEAAQTVSALGRRRAVDGLPRRRARRGPLQGRAGGAAGAGAVGAADQGRRAGGADGHRRGAAARRPRPAQPHGDGARHGDRREARPDYGAPPADRMARGGRAVFFSDFLGDLDALTPGARPCRRPGRARLLRAGARRERGGLPLRRPDDLREHGRHAPSSRPSAPGRCARPTRERLAERRARLAELAPPPRLARAVPPHQPDAARGAALALHGGRRAGMTA